MPNWCDNNLNIITNNPKLINLIKQHLYFQKPSKNQLGLFDTLVPLNLEKESNDKAALAYFQALENWGVKWDVERSDVDFVILKDDDLFEISMRFQTAWDPPIKLIDNLANDFYLDDKENHYEFDVALHFLEFGMDMCGSYFHNGLDGTVNDLSISMMIKNPNEEFFDIINTLKLDFEEMKDSYFTNYEDEVKK